MKKEPIKLLRTGIIITHRCTLRCKLCGSYSPYYHPKPHFTREQIEKTIDRFFAAVDHTGDLSFSGGEPLLHADLPHFLRKAHSYQEQYDRLLVLTNGSLLPDEDLLDAMKLCGEKFQVNISNYGADKSVRCKELTELLHKHGIKWREIQYHGDDLFCDGWVDLRSHTQKFFGEEEIRNHSQECLKQSGGQCLIITGGEMHNCARSYRRMHLGVIPRNPDEYVDFWDDSQPVKELRAKIQKLTALPYTTSCAYCTGVVPGVPRFVPAEQLPAGYRGREDTGCD